MVFMIVSGYTIVEVRSFCYGNSLALIMCYFNNVLMCNSILYEL